MNGGERWQRASRGELLALLGVVAFALALRLIRLGALSFSGDEETATLAALALLDGWPPQLPGGLVYLRGLPFTLLETAALALGGTSEWTMRFIPVLTAAPRIVATWWLARFFGPPRFALAVALLLAVAPFDVEHSRTARMYSLFATLDLAFVALLVRVSVSGVGATWAALSGVLAHLTHALFLVHMPLTLVAALAPRLARGAWPRLLAIGVALLAAVVLELALDTLSYQQMGVARDASLPPGPIAEHRQRLAQVLTFPPAALVAAIGVLAAFWATVQASRELEHGVARVAAFVTFSAWALGSPALGAPGLLGCLILERAPCSALLGRLRGLGLAALASCAAWLAAGLLVSAHGGLAWDFTPRLLLGFPAPNWREFAQATPLLFGLALLGALLAVNRSAKSSHPVAWLILVAAAFAPLLGSGFAGRTGALRFQIHALVPLLVLAMLAANTAVRAMVRRDDIAFAAALLVALIAVRPDQSLQSVLRGYGPVDAPFAIVGVAPDHRGAAAYVREQIADTDLVVAEDPLQQRLYLGRADYWLRRREDAETFLTSDRDGVLRDVYAGSRHIHDLAELGAAIRVEDHDVIWLITSAEVEMNPEWYRTPETDAALRAWRPLAWFVGEDGMTRVYRLVSGKPVAPVGRR